MAIISSSNVPDVYQVDNSEVERSNICSSSISSSNVGLVHGIISGHPQSPSTNSNLIMSKGNGHDGSSPLFSGSTLTSTGPFNRRTHSRPAPVPHQYSILSTRPIGSENPQTEVAELVDKATLMKIHAGAIRHRSLRILSMHMNPPKPLGNDWRGVADYMDFSMLEIHNFALDTDPMGQVMNQWSTKRGSTIGALIDIIKDLEREDALADLERPLRVDGLNWMRRNGAQFEEDPYGLPLQVAEVGTTYPNIPVCPEMRGITLNDIPDGPIETFDAYVCHNPDTDFEFVLEMISAMEKPPYNLRFCTDWRDLVPGGSYATATAELIENRCKRMIVVLSPEFLDSGHCDFQAKFALALSPGHRRKRIVPLMLHWCDVPNMLRHITLCDYTKEDMRPWFWQRLYCALMQI